MRYFLGIDIGASSGRHILGSIQDGRMQLEEIHRFENGMQKATEDGMLCWDTKHLMQEILLGMKKCKELDKIPESVGIDTWAVDFALLDEEGKRIGPVAGYRDKRTQFMDEKVYEKISQEQLYGRTGIQKQIFNTIYQLMAVKEQMPQVLEKAETFLMVPDYFHYLLTGKKGVEYTNATTTQLVSPETCDWDWELIELLGYPKKIFPKILEPGTVLGDLTEEIQAYVGYNCKVVLPATHDTGSAVLAVPFEEDTGLYISSGTWSLMGTEEKTAYCTEESQKMNLTSEGGYEHRFRVLKNIMGLWMIQSVRHEWNDAYSFAEICEEAEKCKEFPSRVDANDDAFLAPESMIKAVQEFCRESGQPVPETVGEIATVIYQSLALCYKKTAEEIETMTGKTYDVIQIVGGGSNAAYLNQLTAEATGKTVYAGPAEATAIGNIAAQMLAVGCFEGRKEARACIRKSFPQKEYHDTRRLGGEGR